MSCNGGKTDAETKILYRNFCFNKTVLFWSEPKTFSSFSDVWFLKKTRRKQLAKHKKSN